MALSLFPTKGLSYLDGPALSSQCSVQASHRVLIVTKMTQPPSSLRDLSAHVLFDPSCVHCPLLVSAEVSINKTYTERLVAGTGF